MWAGSEPPDGPPAPRRHDPLPGHSTFMTGSVKQSQHQSMLSMRAVDLVLLAHAMCHLRLMDHTLVQTTPAVELLGCAFACNVML